MGDTPKMQSGIAHCHVDTEELLSRTSGRKSRSQGRVLLKGPDAKRAGTLETHMARWSGHCGLEAKGSAGLSLSQVPVELQLSHL